ncbi:MAG: transposase, partial [Gemmataceae bacterium]|nr:transposase [Gemmataceae bacterium]
PCCRSEAAMAPVLLRHLEPGMLLLGDRGFLSHKLVQQALGRRARLLARVKKSFVLEPEEVLADGSFLTTLRPPRGGRAAREAGGIRVRVIEYAITGTGHKDDGETHRLLTTLLDPEEHPAQELILLHHERWEQETAFDELKTHLKERPVLRSQSPALVVQELDGLMLAHFAVRAVIQEAAESEGLDPDQVSFTGTLPVLRARLPEVPKGAGKKALAGWWMDLLAEVAEETIPPRRYRFNPRVIKRKMSGWEKKKPHHRRPPKPPKTFRESITII